MAELENNSILSVQIDGRLFGQQILLTLHYRMETVFGSTFNYADAVNNLDAIFNGAGDLFDQYAACQSNNISYVSNTYQAIFPTRYLKIAKTPTVAAGTVAQPCETPNIAAGITLQAELTGRTNRGTKHIGALPTTYVSAGMLTAGAIAELAQLKDLLITARDVNGDGSLMAFPITYHRAAPISSTVIVQGYVHDTVRTMRRRTVGLGS